MTSNSFPPAWWEVAEVVFAIRSFAKEPDYDEALREWRAKIAALPKSGIKRADKRLTARQFDTAVKGAHLAMAGHPDNLGDTLARARWALEQRIRPVFARPKGWVWTDDELDFILECRLNYVEPKFIQYTRQKITEIDGPPTEGRRINPWQKYPIPKDHRTQSSSM